MQRAGVRPVLGAGVLVFTGLALVAVGMVIALLPDEALTYVVLMLFTALGALLFLPRMASREPTVTAGLLGLALAAKMVGALGRYVALQVVYGGVGDATGYHEAGLLYHESVRSLDLSFLQYPYVGTDFVDLLTAIVYAVTGPSMLGAFVLFSLAAFAGGWFFYRAHRIAFPQGNHRVFFVLLFFFPTMVFWPSSLGKDALVIFGMGLGTYGLARLLGRPSPTAIMQLALGLGFTFAVRPAVGAVFLFGAAIAFMLHPGRLGSPLTRPVTLLMFAPVLVVGMLYTVQLASTLEGYDLSAEGATTYYTETSENVATGGSSFEPAAPTSVGGALEAAATVLFRPFPGEAGASGQAILAGLESLAIMGLFVFGLGRVLRAFRLWRGGMIVTAWVVTLGLIAALAAFANFGLLARQRAQLLPFFFMILTAVPGRRMAARASTAATVPAVAQPAPEHASATVGDPRMRRTASATRST